MKVDQRFKKGIELFNEGEYFECHEVIEDLWLETPTEDPNRDLYKGVIQAAAAIYQFERGILSGAIGLFRTSAGYLENYRPHALGLNVGLLVEDMKGCFKPLADWDGVKNIPFNRKSAPQLDFDINS